ncbi:MAG: hypothetical protein GY696_20790 [Gammaproteobacteria bacterium]|nr:hypothetical protein [Gammaproteobacteria bacterium]
MTKIEGILNSRPLTYGGDELEDLDRVISPANFLVGHRKLGVPVRAHMAADAEADADPNFLPGEIPSETVLKLLKNRDRVLDHFWKLWHTDYLNSLRSRSHNFHRHPRVTAKSSPWVGEIVLIHDADLPRSAWRLGRILSFKFGGPDGDQIKSAEIRVPNGRIIRRPVNLLYPLEIPRRDSIEEQGTKDPVDKAQPIKAGVTKDDDSRSSQVKRSAAIRCQERIRDQTLVGLLSFPRECSGIPQSRRRNL